MIELDYRIYEFQHQEWQIAERAIEATKELEKTLGLQRTEYTKSTDRRVRIGE